MRDIVPTFSRSNKTFPMFRHMERRSSEVLVYSF
jgi:hypothetical protein